MENIDLGGLRLVLVQTDGAGFGTGVDRGIGLFSWRKAA